MNENNEVRLIDANKIKPVHVEYYGKVVDWATIEYAPTIDPETLPIVRKLREELARVMGERDNLKELLYDVKPCSLCEKYTKTWNPVCIKCDSSTKAYRPDFVLNERGQQKEE